jgi:diguanylate cyclase (GGDEF)-like protein/PAS domain S-box-containing protein
MSRGEEGREARLLIVDDKEGVRELLKRCFQKSYSVHSVASGDECLSYVENHPVDLVLLDVEMPGISGLKVLEVLRAKYSPSDLPIIMVTARSESEDIVQALEAGANDYVTKPMDLAVVGARVKTHLALKRGEEARRETEERYSLAAAGSNDGIWDWDLRSNTIYLSTRWKAMLGYEPNELGESVEEWLSRIHPEDRLRVDGDLKAHFDNSDSHFESEHRIRHRDGSYLWTLSRGMAVRDGDQKPYRLAGSLTDITSGKVMCALTGLPNRVLFMDRLARVVDRRKRRPGHHFAVLFLDLDRFKLINDSLGHLCGDQFLVGVARRLERNLRSTDAVCRLGKCAMLARLGGDEFAVLLDDLASPEDAVRVAERLIACLKEPFMIAGNEVFAGVSIGAVTSTFTSQTPEEFLRDADTAMYRAKASGRGRVEIFDAEMRAAAVARLQLESEVKHAAEHSQFTNWYQAIVSLEDGRICGFEALLRWDRPQHGIVTPDKFMSVVEETGLIVSVGLQALADACRDIRSWRETYPAYPLLSVSVNLSARQFGQHDLFQKIRETIVETGIDPSCLRLEITESMVMHDPDAAAKTLAGLRGIGVRISMDDFGTGYSSLMYLHRFPLDVLKIDRSFIAGMETHAEKFEIVKTTISLAHNLGLEVVAEGVESPKQMTLLKGLGCEFGQGFLYSKPVSAQSVRTMLAANPSWPIPLQTAVA